VDCVRLRNPSVKDSSLENGSPGLKEQANFMSPQIFWMHLFVHKQLLWIIRYIVMKVILKREPEILLKFPWTTKEGYFRKESNGVTVHRFVLIRAKARGNHSGSVKTSKKIKALLTCSSVISRELVEMRLLGYCFLMYIFNYSIIPWKKSLELGIINVAMLIYFFLVTSIRPFVIISHPHLPYDLE
jgi:hypothetical protein